MKQEGPPGEGCLEELAAFDWTDLPRLRLVTRQVLDTLTADNYRMLHDLVARLPEQPDLHRLCERIDCMDKLVIWASSGDRVRLRMHIFCPGYADLPHDHRFTFVSRILRGGYLHYIYPRSALSDVAGNEPPQLVRMESAESEYLMTERAVHSFSVSERTVTLVIRGPIVKESATVVNRAAGTRFQLHSAKSAVDNGFRSYLMSHPEILRGISVIQSSLPGPPGPSSLPSPAMRTACADDDGPQ